MTCVLRRPDAQIAYDVAGSGPALLLVGAPAGRDGFLALAQALAPDALVVTHDPRGIGASTLGHEAAEPTPEVLAADLAALVREVTDQPALFFGASGGAVTLLALAVSEPRLVRRAVLHEPPLVRLLDDPALEERARHAFGIADTDPQAATQAFLDLTGAAHETGPGEVPPPHTPVPALPEPELDKQRYFLGRMAGPTVFHEPGLAALRRVDLRVCAGALSHGQLAHRAAQVLADRLGTSLVDLPGNHLAPSTRPAECAPVIRELLRP